MAFVDGRIEQAIVGNWTAKTRNLTFLVILSALACGGLRCEQQWMEEVVDNGHSHWGKAVRVARARYENGLAG